MSSGQITGVTADQTPPIPGVGHDYIEMLNDAVNPATGALSSRINAPVPKGRGLTLPFSFNYDSAGTDRPWSNVFYYQPIANGAAIPYTYMSWTSNTSFVSQGGWSYSVPLLTATENFRYLTTNNPKDPCTYINEYVFQDPDGGRHVEGLALAWINQGCQHEPYSVLASPALSGYLYPDDETYQAVTSFGSGQSIGPTSVVDPSGTVYNFNLLDAHYTTLPHLYNCVGNCAESLAVLPSSIEDRNGNMVTIQDNGGGAFAVTDTAGRVEYSSTGFGASGNQVNVSGMSGPYTVTWGTASSNFTATFVEVPGGNCNYMFPPGGLSSVPAIKRIMLPNGTSYQILYDPTYGFPQKVIYPTGGYVRYVWGLNSLAEPLTTPTFDSNGNYLGPCYYEYDEPAILHRYVSFDGTHEVLEQDFQYSTTWGCAPPGCAGSDYVWNWTSKGTTVATKDLVRGTSFQTVYVYSPSFSAGTGPAPNDEIYYSTCCLVPVEQSATYYDTNGATLRTVNQSWATPSILTSEQLVLPNGLTSETDYSYAFQQCTSSCTPFYANRLTEKDEYDFASGARGSLLRKTIYNYQQFKPTPLFPSVQSIVDRPCQVVTYDGSGNGNRFAETDYFYDNASTATLCGAAGTPSVSGAGGSTLTGHDETNYSAASTNPRGNLTQKTQWINTGSSSPASTYTYDETGQITSMTDPNGNQTSYSHADSFLNTNSSGFTTTAGAPPTGMVTNAYLTKITRPTTNGVAHIENFSYGYNDGELTQISEEHSQLTTNKYNDSLSRLTESDYPDGGQTLLSYNDTAPSPSVTTCQLINGTAGATCSSTSPPTGWKTTLSSMDGLGHVVQTELVSDPDPHGPTYTVTKLDGLGRPYTVTNPYRSTTDLTYGVTTYFYDALGRKCLLVPADSTVPTSQTCPTAAISGDEVTIYSGNQTTFIDEAANERTTQTDGLGRLTYVWEAPNSSDYETLYAYDPLNNLLSVNQQGGSTNSANWRTRTFTYDSLSRLLCAANPEVQIVTCPASATGSFPSFGAITYSYDANGNLTTRTAPLPNQRPTGTATVTATFAYDRLNRLTSKSYMDGSTQDPYTPTVQFGYDAIALTNCTTAPPALTDSYPKGRQTAMCDGSGGTSRSHDPMGRVLQESRIIGTAFASAMSVTYGYNKDGSIASLTTPPMLMLSYTVGGAGRATSVVDSGDSVNFATSATYAPQGELAGATLGAASNFAGITVSNAYNDRLQPLLLSATSPTATVFSECFDFHLGVAITQPSPCSFSKSTLGDNGNVYTIVNNRDNTRTQSFTYDVLNRIASGQSSGTHWGETFTTDAWANLTNTTGISGKTYGSGLNTSAGTNNQLAGFGYDPAGNMTSNGSNSYLYDAENRLVWTSGYRYIYDGNGQRVEKCTVASATTACPTSGTTGKLYWRGTGSDTLYEGDLGGNPQEQYVYFAGGRIARRDVSSTGATVGLHYYFSDHLGSHAVVETVTTSGGTSCDQDIDYYPYGGEENDYCAGSGVSQNYKFTGKERDGESGLDMFGARYYGSSLGRFMSPDPVGGHNEDPQTLNRYAYVRNNPLSLTDPTGLDFYLTCTQNKDNASTCQGGHVGTTTTTTDANGKTTSTFTPTVITSASLQDPNSGNKATVNENGVQITTANGTFGGEFKNNTPAANGIQGSGALAGFTFDINYSDKATGNLAGGFFHFNGSPEEAERLLASRGAFNALLDFADGTIVGFHPFTEQYRFGTGPSSHLSVPDPYVLPPDQYNPAGVPNPRYTVPVTGDYHVDAHIGTAHAKDVINSLF